MNYSVRHEFDCIEENSVEWLKRKKYYINKLLWSTTRKYGVHIMPDVIFQSLLINNDSNTESYSIAI